MKTQREMFAAYLEHTGHRCTVRTKRRWSYFNPHTGQYNYLGASGSWRVGPNVTRSIPVSAKVKAMALAMAPGVALVNLEDLL